MVDTPLPVFLNGSRTYVQGTQILARTADAIAFDGEVVLKQAVFQNITDRGVAIAEAPGPTETALGRAQFTTADGETRAVNWVALGEGAPRKSVSLPCRWAKTDTASDHPLSATFDIENLSSGEDYLNALIQSIKGLHDALASDVRDIWFTGLRRSNIPLPGFPETKGTLHLTFDRIMGRDGEYQSIQRTKFEGASGQVIEAVVTFAFKSEEFTHVD